MVAREFRKEVTNTVIWARKFGMKIQCIKIKPFNVGEYLVVDTDQIIPVKDVADIMIGYDQKAQEDAKDKETRGYSMDKGCGCKLWQESGRDWISLCRRREDFRGKQ